MSEARSTENSELDVLSGFFVTAAEREEITASVRSDTYGKHSTSLSARRELMAFWLADEQYAFDIADVQEIIKIPSITSVPRVPDFILGITSLRGTVVPLIDLRQVLGLRVSELTKNARVLVLKGNGAPLGLVTDSVSSVLRVERHTVEPPPVNVARRSLDFIKAISRVDGSIIILLHSDAIMALLAKEVV